MMRPTQWIAASLYAALIALTWVRGGAAAGVLFLICALFLTAVFRVNEAGDGIFEFARRQLRRRAAGSPSS